MDGGATEHIKALEAVGHATMFQCSLRESLGFTMLVEKSDCTYIYVCMYVDVDVAPWDSRLSSLVVSPP